MLEKLFNIFLILVCFTSLAIGATFVLQGDISFYTDIARDFLLLDEIEKKLFILVGPRADWKGLFHGPLWLYINYPAYVLGNGNPVVMGWWWISLTALISLAYYYIVKKLYKNTQIGLTFAALFLMAMSAEMHQYYNPIGALFAMPFYIYTALQYYKTKKIIFLIFHLLLAGVMIQFQLAVGIPLMLLSAIWTFYVILKNKQYKHLAAFLVALIPLSTFILFNLKYDFSYVRGVMEHFSSNSPHESLTFVEKLNNRVDVMTKAALWFIKGPAGNLNILIGFFISAIVTKVFILKDKKYISSYAFFLYFYIGFFILTFAHSGWVLSHYFLPLITLPMLIFSTAIEHINKKVFYSLFIVIALITLTATALSAANSSKILIGKSQTSWKFLSKVLNTPYDNSNEKEFGLYIYAPDVYAYAPKYAALYSQRVQSNKRMVYNKKLKETFLVYEPPPKDRPDLNGKYWKTDKVKINSAPVKVINFENGYRVEKYILDENEIQNLSDPSIDDWISQR